MTMRSESLRVGMKGLLMAVFATVMLSGTAMAFTCDPTDPFGMGYDEYCCVTNPGDPSCVWTNGDGDTIPDAYDNCPFNYNEDQMDNNFNGIGDACEGVGDHCTNGYLDEDEEGTDCGGLDCAPCGGPAHCFDTTQNYDETGVDCGGIDCAPCGGNAVYLSETNFTANGVNFTLYANDISPLTPQLFVMVDYYDPIADAYYPLTMGDDIYDNGPSGSDWFAADSDPTSNYIATDLAFNGFFAPGQYYINVDYYDAGDNWQSVQLPFTVSPTPGICQLSGQVDNGAFIGLLQDVNDEEVIHSFAFPDMTGAYALELPAVACDAPAIVFAKTADPYTSVSEYTEVNVPAGGMSGVNFYFESPDANINVNIMDYVSATSAGDDFDIFAETEDGHFVEGTAWGGSGYLNVLSGVEWMVEVELNDGSNYFSIVCDSSPNFDSDCTITPTVSGPNDLFYTAFPITATIDVTVEDEYGQPAEGVLAAVNRMYDEYADPILNTLGNGKYSDPSGFASVGVMEGDWGVSLCTSCHVNKVNDVEVELVPGLNTQVTTYYNSVTSVTMTTYYADGVIEGYVYDSENNPVPYVRVNAQSWNAENNMAMIPGVDTQGLMTSTDTDMSGYYRLPLLGGDWQVWADDYESGLQSTQVPVYMSVDGNDSIDQAYETVTGVDLTLNGGTVEPYCSDFVGTSAANSVHISGMTCGLYQPDIYVSFNGVYYYIDGYYDDTFSNFDLYLVNVDQQTGEVFGGDYPNFSGDTGQIEFYSSFPTGGQGTSVAAYGVNMAPEIDWLTSDYAQLPMMGDYVDVDGTYYTVMGADSEYCYMGPGYSCVALYEVDQATGTILDDGGDPPNPIYANFTGAEQTITFYGASFPGGGQTVATPDCTDMVYDSMSSALRYTDGSACGMPYQGYVEFNGTFYLVEGSGSYYDGMSTYYYEVYVREVDQSTGQDYGTYPYFSGEAGTINFYSVWPFSSDPVDSDGDGMSDAYETDNGLNPNLDDRYNDLDGDGFDNVDEFNAGSDPNDYNDTPEVSNPYFSTAPATVAADNGPVVFDITGVLAGDSVELSIYYDQNGNGVVDPITDWPLVTGFVTDDGTSTNEEDLSGDINLTPGQIQTAFGDPAEFGLIGPGSFVARVAERTGYNFDDIPFVVTPTAAANEITGRIEDPSNPGVGVPGVIVWFAEMVGVEDYRVVTFGFTDANGDFALQVDEALPINGALGYSRDDMYYLGVEDDPSLQLNLTTTTDLGILPITMGDAAVTGFVRDYYSLKPVYGVQFWGPNNSGSYAEAKSDQTGWYSMPAIAYNDMNVEGDDLPPGYFAVVEAESGNYNSDAYVYPNPLPADNIVDFWAFAETAAIDVTVYDEYGAPVEGIEVSASRDWNDGAPYNQLMTAKFTDVNGHAKVGVNAGNWQVGLCTACHKPKVAAVEYEMVPGPNQMVDNLTDGESRPISMTAYYADAAIEGYLYNADGSPAFDVEVNAYANNAYNNGGWIGDAWNQVRTDMNGFFRIPVLEGDDWYVQAMDFNNDQQSMEYWIYNIYTDDNDAIDQPGEVYEVPQLFLLPSHCFNEIQDMDETGTDSGGSCEFTPPIEYQLTVNVYGPGSVVSTAPDSSIDTTIGNYSSWYVEGTDVTLEVPYNSGIVFEGWGGSAASCIQDPFCMITMDADMTADAYFDYDSDNDGIGDSTDICPNDPTDTCQECTAGSWFDGSECQICPADSYSSAGATSCDACPAGASSFPGSETCFPDADGDYVADSVDICSAGDDNLDADVDGVPDACDVCQWFDDSVDSDADGTPDGCETIGMVSPNGGETYTVGATYTIEWEAHPLATKYNLHYFDADDTPYVVAKLGNVTSFEWTIPAGIVIESGKNFRVTAFDGTNVKLDEAWSAGAFTVVPEPFVMTAPTDGATLLVGQTYAVQWDAHPQAVSYNIHYFDADATPVKLAGNVTGTSFNWMVNPSVITEAGKTLRITAFNSEGAKLGEAWMAGTFTVDPDPFVMTSPVNGETWNLGTQHTIQWGAHPQAVRYNVHYFDADNTPHKLAGNVTETSFVWDVPYGTIVEGNKTVRITAFDSGDAKLGEAWIDGTFAVGPAFAMVTPAGGESWPITNTVTIEWSAHPLATHYNLHYFDSDSTPHKVALFRTGTSYSWTIPADAVIESGKSFRVTAFADDLKLEEAWSAGTFSVAPNN